MTSWRAWPWAPWALGLSCGLVLLHLWLRCPSEVDVLPPFRRLRAECLRVYAELLAVLALTGAQEQTEDPLAEVLDQPLVLSSALSACARRVAKHLGWRSEDLEAVVESYAGLEPEVMEGLSELKDMHRSCLEKGEVPGLGSKNPWLSESPEQDATRALQVLQDLGERKVKKLAELKPGPGLGPRILQLCEEVEQDFWADLEGSEPSLAEVSFGAAVCALDRGDFQERYTKLMKDLEVTLPSLGRR